MSLEYNTRYTNDPRLNTPTAMAMKATDGEVLHNLLQVAVLATEEARTIESRLNEVTEDLHRTQARALNAWNDFAKALSDCSLAPSDIRERLNGNR